MKADTVPLAFCLLLLCLGPAAVAQHNPNGQLPVTTTPHPYLFLIRDPVVLDELRATAEQRGALQAVSDTADSDLWSMRNQGPDHTEKTMRAATAAAQEKVSAILSAGQRQRLQQIEWWVLGTKAFLGEELPSKLRLSDTQRDDVREVVREMQAAHLELVKEVQNGGDRESAEKKSTRLQSDLQRKILAKLSPQQQQQWVELLGRRIDLSKLGYVTFKAPDLTSESDWINSPPISSEQLRGKVVALHFYAFGCINCKRNFPWYKEWHSTFSHRGLVVLGIQTPETQRERVVDNIRAAAKENGLEYPIVVDSEKRNWNAWGNSMWPSTYLIDKSGRVRYWWYGELDWQGAGGQNVLRSRIEELLAEDAPASPVTQRASAAGGAEVTKILAETRPSI